MRRSTPWTGLLLLSAAFSAGCMKSAAPSLPPTTPPPSRPATVPVDTAAPPNRKLQGAEASEWALSLKALEALEKRDAAALGALRITEREYKDLLFPELPAAGPGQTIPVDTHWYLLDMKSLKGLREVIQDYGGEKLELLEVIPTGGVEEYKTFKLLKKVELRVRRPNGEESRIRVFGSIFVLDGQFKVVSFPS